MSIVDEALALMRDRGGAEYFGEGVSQLAHGLQAAMLAQRAGAPDALVAAALLHDAGHMLSGQAETCADRGLNDRHEEVGARWLLERFGPEVAGPVSLHVEAKRYLVARDARYREHLSPASIQSLALQGGPMSAQESEGFRCREHAEDALRLRGWDELAKDPDALNPTLEDLRPLLVRVAQG